MNHKYSGPEDGPLQDAQGRRIHPFRPNAIVNSICLDCGVHWGLHRSVETATLVPLRAGELEQIARFELDLEWANEKLASRDAEIGQHKRNLVEQSHEMKRQDAYIAELEAANGLLKRSLALLARPREENLEALLRLSIEMENGKRGKGGL